MGIRTKTTLTLSLAAALIAVALMAFAPGAQAGHTRPQGATPVYTQLVPAYKQCQLADSNHNGGMVGLSCTFNSPGRGGPSSTNLCTGTPDGPCPAPAQGNGWVKLCSVNVPGGCAAVGDIAIDSVITDVRCVPAPPGGLPCASAANSNNGTQNTLDYIGQLQGALTLRISDHYNGTGTTPATVEDLPLNFTLGCAFVNTAIGSTCQVHTSFNAVVPGASVSGKRASTEVGQIVVRDGGTDGLAGTAGNSDFMRSGIFVP